MELFLSADVAGKWIITNGYADVTASTGNVTYAPDADPHACADAEISDDEAVTARIKPFREVPPYSLRGSLYSGGDTTSLILTDGSTVLGLTQGPNSSQPNLA
jgi:hypothetical protein